VFEPNSAPFRRAVERGFERLLEDIFKRGAFAGQTATDAFQVVTNETINTPASVDQGRFFVELRVAPSRPLRFLTVKLLQTSTGISITEGT